MTLAPTRLRLNDGHYIPALGLGVWQVPAETTHRTVAQAIGLGYRLIDGAAIYGNEAGLGAGVRAAGLPREEVFVTTKIWNDRQGYDNTLRAFDASLQRLGLDTVELCLIHWPVPAQDRYVETWRALIRLRDDGRVRSIGVSNFLGEHLERIVGETGVVPVVNQIELHPRLQQADLRRLHAAMGIVTQSWTPLGRNQCFDAPAVRDAAARTGRTPAQVILRWHLQLGCAAIPRSTDPGRLAQNLDLGDFALDDAEMAAMSQLDDGSRIGPDPATFS